MEIKRNVVSRFLLLWVVGMLLSVQVFAQGLTVKGVVKDNTGMGVIGANILVKGTTNGTITDFDGNFTLEAKKGDVIVISFIGYKTQEVPAAATLNVTLQDDAEVLDDVVVIGYGSVKKNDATGSVTAIKPDELSKGITTNAQDMLTGKVAGVSVISNDGTPGGGAQIRIRGGSSLNASNDPLIVIDGLAIDNSGIKGMSNGLSMVNPEDIETFTVLKDASATAIYGSRASNGVIIITTKKGKSGQARGSAITVPCRSLPYRNAMTCWTGMSTVRTLSRFLETTCLRLWAQLIPTGRMKSFVRQSVRTTMCLSMVV